MSTLKLDVLHGNACAAFENVATHRVYGLNEWRLRELCLPQHVYDAGRNC